MQKFDCVILHVCMCVCERETETETDKLRDRKHHDNGYNYFYHNYEYTLDSKVSVLGSGRQMNLINTTQALASTPGSFRTLKESLVHTVYACAKIPSNPGNFSVFHTQYIGSPSPSSSLVVDHQAQRGHKENGNGQYSNGMATRLNSQDFWKF